MLLFFFLAESDQNTKNATQVQNPESMSKYLISRFSQTGYEAVDKNKASTPFSSWRLLYYKMNVTFGNKQNDYCLVRRRENYFLGVFIDNF